MIIQIGRLRLEHDRDYGCNLRSGWSVAINGRYVAELTGFWRAMWAALTK